MASTCLVSAMDYLRHFTSATQAASRTRWDGTERRSAMRDRRLGLHDRRWEAAAGRRQRLGDRRRTS
jgi:hypothetical protein